MLDAMQRRARRASGISTIPARLLVLVLCTALASSAVQLLQRPGTAVAGLPNATPSGTPTNTPAPDTATPSSTPTNTEVPATATASSTPTNTEVPATATASSTPTNTEVPATATASGTATSTPTGTASGTATSTATTTPPATPTITPTAEVGTALCSDGIDNNLNGLIDCADPSCAGSGPCIAAAPALSPVLLLLSIAALSLLGLLQLRRRLR